MTGAGGFVGCKLVQELIDRGYSVRVLTRHQKHEFPSGVEVFVADLTSTECDLSGFFSDCDIFFHCAGELHNTQVMRELHVNGTERLRDALLHETRRSGHQIHWVQLSSVGVYGKSSKPSEVRAVKEDSPISPSGMYEITKAQSDAIMLTSLDSHGLTGTILRPSNIVGMNMPNQSFLGLLQNVVKGYFFYIGSRDVVSNYVHVDDVVDALILCAESPAANGQVFNLSNDCLLSDIVKAVSQLMGKNSNYLIFPEFFIRLIIWCIPDFINFPLSVSRIDSLVSRTRYSNNKIKSALNFSPKRFIPEFSIEYIRKKRG